MRLARRRPGASPVSRPWSYDDEGLWFELAKPKHWVTRRRWQHEVGLGAIGGSLEPGESLDDCWRREALEEIGVIPELRAARETVLRVRGTRCQRGECRTTRAACPRAADDQRQSLQSRAPARLRHAGHRHLLGMLAPAAASGRSLRPGAPATREPRHGATDRQNCRWRTLLALPGVDPAAQRTVASPGRGAPGLDGAFAATGATQSRRASRLPGIALDDAQLLAHAAKGLQHAVQLGVGVGGHVAGAQQRLALGGTAGGTTGLT